jgi:hypothetical protein
VREQHAAEMRRVVGGFERSGLPQAACCASAGDLAQAVSLLVRDAGNVTTTAVCIRGARGHARPSGGCPSG